MVTSQIDTCIIELVNLAYPLINDETRGTIAKNYFVCRLHPEMQAAIARNQLRDVDSRILFQKAGHSNHFCHRDLVASVSCYFRKVIILPQIS